MLKLDEELRHLVTQACKNPPGSLQRQKLLTQIIRLTANKLWKETTSYYQDALQQTWLYFCRNICEANTGQAYDPNYGSVVTWLNAYLKRRLQDFYINQQREQIIKVPLKVLQSGSGDRSEIIDPVENLAATPEAPPILDNVRMWVKADTTGDLRATCVKGRPDVNCQILILKRLPPEASWKELSEQFGLPIPTLSSFYQRQCLPRLRKFAEVEGYL
ncbi:MULTISPECIES: sigma-70 family RNA polymerase sigma factor [Calothrix]|uniref:Sigma-70 family RNA polymerase sigma factor n=2 Tax=Calothrix TaxID=1186 RepID=A0ABR8AA57_9CYAN|nr:MULTISPECIES: sigma-70 family RNA polymerase sigma factor [Calothrix]MBD2196689.1 sigma-70 family RNA polymerase sigma factor [Calothrix parietina FACHB-288]MBD2224214.1 sigma-70 family RNA polymerase sigma factor [Calothrix anomala FACHB-343]